MSNDNPTLPNVPRPQVQSLPHLVDAIVDSIHAQPNLAHLNRVYLPSRDAVVHAIELLRQVTFPGFFGSQIRGRLSTDSVRYHVGQVMVELNDLMYEQVRCCLRYRKNLPNGSSVSEDCEACDRDARRIVGEFLQRIPAVRELISSDVQAAYDADPAAQNTDETILSYPGLVAISIQRYAHELYLRDVPMLPRIMTEHAHSLTGIDIHPGAKLGQRFFIDHGTAVVIGETTVIGENVKIYQGVTLGGLAPDRLVEQFRGGRKRHPTIENNVTIYAGATILGGDTVIGSNSIIGGNVFLTSSVPPDMLVSMEDPQLKIRPRKHAKGKPGTSEFLDFQI
jgi:serine O-acetyltransferase